MVATPLGQSRVAAIQHRDLSGGVDVLGDNDLFVLMCQTTTAAELSGLRRHTNSSLTLSADTSPSVDSSATLGS
jgi:hypothetical protein